MPIGGAVAQLSKRAGTFDIKSPPYQSDAPLFQGPKSLTVLQKLATSLGQRDEVPNQILAQEIARAKDKKAVKELVENLSHQDKSIQSDCIKVLYEISF